MRRRLALIAVVLWLPGLTEAQQSVKCPGAGPLSEAQLTDLVKGSVPAARIGQLVKNCGIDFEPTGEFFRRLRSAGTPEAVLNAVRSATGPAERKRQAEQALWGSIKDSQDPQVLAQLPHFRGRGTEKEGLTRFLVTMWSPPLRSPKSCAGG